MKLFHSTDDTVVPYVNAQRAKKAFGDMVELEDAPNKLDHVDTGIDFFRGDSDVGDVAISRIFNTRLNEYVKALCKQDWERERRQRDETEAYPHAARAGHDAGGSFGRNRQRTRSGERQLQGS